MSARTIDTVVTFLAMTARPRILPQKPPGPPLALMKVDAIPLHYYRYLYKAVGMNWLWYERLLLDDEALQRKVHKEGVEIYVLYAAGAPAGYYELDFSRKERPNIVYFGLMPEWTGRRIGPWLLGSAVAEAFSRGAKELTVNTCTLDHPAALPLYQRLGFKPVARENRRINIPANLPLPENAAARGAP
jgi:GNAT superfamily N-acetyltransferase